MIDGFPNVIARGASGRLKVAYEVAVELGAWQAATTGEAMGGGDWRLTAAVRGRHPYYAEHSTVFDLELDVGQNRWRWRNVRAEVGPTAVSVAGSGEPDIL